MLRIGEPHVVFDRSNALSDIFYDDINRKIVTVRGEGVLEVKAHGLGSNGTTSLRLKGKGKIRIIKFSPDERLICVQYDDSAVDFINFTSRSEDILSAHLSQSTKNRSARIIGLEWVQRSQILYITNQGLELYQVNMDKKSVKLLKSHNVSLFWFIYYPYSQLLIVSSGAASSLLNSFIIQNGNIHRMAKFEVDFGRSNTKTQLLEREVSIVSIYNALYITVLRSSTRASTNSDVALYKLSGDGTGEPQLAHILCLGTIGAFALHVFNNLIVVHHQSSKTSLFFDIGLEDKVEKTGCISHEPLLKTSLNCTESLQNKFSNDFPLYCTSWVMFQPNLITDANIGVFTAVSLDSIEATDFIKDKYQYLRFLYNRNVGKSIFLGKLKLCMVMNKLKLKQVESIFNWIAKAIVKRAVPILKHIDSGVKYTLMVEPYEEMDIEQEDIIGYLFLLPDDYTPEQRQRFLQYMLRFLTALSENKLEVQPYFLNEILVPTMVATGQLGRLHQLLLYRVIPDAKQLYLSVLFQKAADVCDQCDVFLIHYINRCLTNQRIKVTFQAFQLLSHEAKYPPLVQLALDMLSRLGTATEEIVEVLMARGLVVEAIRFLESSQSMDKVNGLKLIESAWKENRQIRYAVFSYFLEHGSKIRNNITSCEQFEEFSKKFRSLFDDEEIETARKDCCFITIPRNETDQQ